MLLSLLIVPIVGVFIISASISYENGFNEGQVVVGRWPGGWGPVLLKSIALTISIINLIVSLMIFIMFDFSSNLFQFVQEYHEIGSYDFYLGLDGLSIYFVLLTTMIMPIVLLSNWKSIGENVRSYLIIVLLLETLLLAVFLVLDILLFYIFFESILPPLFLLIGLFGTSNKVRASFYLFLYTLFACSIFLLLLLTMPSLIWISDFHDGLYKTNFNYSQYKNISGIQDIIDILPELDGIHIPPHIISILWGINGSLFILRLLWEIMERDKKSNKTNTIEIDVAVFITNRCVILFDLNDRTGGNLSRLYRDQSYLWSPYRSEVFEDRIYYTGIAFYLDNPYVHMLWHINEGLFEPVLKTTIDVYSRPAFNLIDLQFTMAAIAPNYSTWLSMVNDCNLIFKSEGEIIPLSVYKPIDLNLNFYGTGAGGEGMLSHRDMLLQHGIDANLFIN